jgi:hypothetical protein
MMHSFITYTLHKTLYNDKMKEYRIIGHVAGMAEIGNLYKMLITKCERKKTLLRPSSRQEDNKKGILKNRGELL